MFMFYKKIGTINENNELVLDTSAFPALPKIGGTSSVDESYIRKTVYAINEFFINENVLRAGVRETEPIENLMAGSFNISNDEGDSSTYSYNLDSFTEVFVSNKTDGTGDSQVKLNIEENGVYLAFVSQRSKDHIKERAQRDGNNNVNSGNSYLKLIMPCFIFRYPHLNNKEIYRSFYDIEQLERAIEGGHTPYVSLKYDINEMDNYIQY